MNQATVTDAELAELLEHSARPIYAVDAQRGIVFCNAALAAWLGLDAVQIVGRLVEYHSEPASDGRGRGDGPPPLTDLCPPPQALAGEPCIATVSCVARDGRLVHRRADFVPLGTDAGGVLVLLAADDLSPQELASELAAEPSGDELHRAIRRFRRSQAGEYGIESLLGESSAMRRVRAQVAAAAASGANTLILGRPGTGRAHVARAIHYRATGPAVAKFVPLDGELVTDDLLRRTCDALRITESGGTRPTLLLKNVEQLSESHQAQLFDVVSDRSLVARLLATAAPDRMAEVHAGLADALSTITIQLPGLSERVEDLPLVAQCFLEACNRGGAKQVGGLRPETLDLLALYRWPGELDELREVIAGAHRACEAPAISPADLPAVIHHAQRAASLPRRPVERIVLDDLLAAIEKEAIERALAQASGNKTEAAELLGMTRPRLYRRLVQLGLAGEPTPTELTPLTEPPEAGT